MAARIAVGLPNNKRQDTTSSALYPSYWNAENHTSSASGNAYLRAEEWLKDLKEFSLPVRNVSIPINLAMGEAIMRYREELKMYAAIFDQNNNNQSNVNGASLIPSMEDILFLDERHDAVKSEWPAGKERATWWNSLEVCIFISIYLKLC
jgi:hypothetical protein